MADNAHLLIVDDDENIRITLQDMFAWHGYAVSVVGSGAEALDFLENNQPDIALVDMMLPDTWGTELIRYLKKIYPGLLCIIITGDPSLDAVIDAMHHGAEAFFQKPLDMREVLPRLETILEKKHLREELEQERFLLAQANKQIKQAYNDLKQTQSQIVQQEKMASIGQLAAGVAHEINNPMGFIASNLASLAKYLEKLTQFIVFQDQALAGLHDEKTIAELRDERKKLKIDYLLDDIPALINESLDGAERVRIIVQNLKNFSRVDQNEISLTNVNECIETTLNIVWNELKYKATVTKQYGDLPRIKASAQQLNQVFMNILVNAAQSMTTQGTITIKTWRDQNQVHISIADTGCGIAPQHLSRIFEPFYTTKEIGKGTGLGMSIAYDIIKKHHGTITVESEVGRGTTFTVSLPVEEE